MPFSGKNILQQSKHTVNLGDGIEGDIKKQQNLSGRNNLLTGQCNVS